MENMQFDYTNHRFNNASENQKITLVTLLFTQLSTEGCADNTQEIYEGLESDIFLEPEILNEFLELIKKDDYYKLTAEAFNAWAQEKENFETIYKVGLEVDENSALEFVVKYIIYGDEQIEDGISLMTESEIEDYAFNMLEGDSYLLGSFNDWFLAENTDLPIDMIRACQKHEEYEAIGDSLTKEDILNLVREQIRLDGPDLAMHREKVEEVKINGEWGFYLVSWD